jgi:16S rRNA (adenine1518-N6/adenine1519-N6)-dimethyltransferase
MERSLRGSSRPRKRFGQHFLEPAWVVKLIDSLGASPGDTVLEIGPGRGALTLPLAPRIGRLLAVEIDRDLAATLAPKLPAHARIVCDDFLGVDLPELLGDEALPIRVVGNLPYNVSSPILFTLFRAADQGRRISDATLMLQKEVADRLVARPGDPDYGGLAIQTAAAADVERILSLPPGAFRPPPRIWSAVVRLRFRPAPFVLGSPAIFERLVRGVFLHRRKTLTNALRPVATAIGADAADLIEKAGLDGTVRPETLTPEEFGRLAMSVL